MAKSTGPILAVGIIATVNRTIFNGKSMDWRVPIATGIAASILGFIEKASPDLAMGIAYLTLITVSLTRVDPSIPSPAESALSWFNSSK